MGVGGGEVISLSWPLGYIHTCIKYCNIKMSSSLKQLDQFSLDFTLGFLSKGYYQFIQMALHY